MKLTGKCAEAFKEWSKGKGIENFNAKNYSLNLAKALYNAILIDFFDSVDIFISIQKYNGVVNWKVNHRIGHCHGATNERKLSCDEALKKANEIFNSRS